MDANIPSGMYKCTICHNVVSHIQGKEFLPCTECNKVSWEIIKQDEDYLASIQQKDTIQSDFEKSIPNP